MTTWIVSYADAGFRTTQQMLTQSAHRYGIDVTRAWTREMLQQTPFYAAHRQVLDLRRGSGYWLWKPFIIRETLREMSAGDLLVYADAGIAIAADLTPVLALCREGRDIVLFANHYREAGANDCGTWTKRDCFVQTGCDEARYHDGLMTDASFLIVRKSERAIAFIDEWLSYACRGDLLTDAPTSGPLPNLPRFIEHRHDQSILSLLAIREGVELFRHPSQHGNHLKEPRLREADEWTRFPYGSSGILRNSPYGTLLNHHRGALGQANLRVAIRRTIPESRAEVFDGWTRRDVLGSWSPEGYEPIAADADVRTGGAYRIELRNRQPGLGHKHLQLAGEYVEVRPPARLVYTAPGGTEVVVRFTDADGGTTVDLEHGCFRTEALRERYGAIWSSFLDHLAARLVKQARQR